jgi:hypothetical protein
MQKEQEERGTKKGAETWQVGKSHIYHGQYAHKRLQQQSQPKQKMIHASWHFCACLYHESVPINWNTPVFAQRETSFVCV